LSSECAQQIEKHDAVSKLGFVVEPVDLAAILWHSSKWKNIVKNQDPCWEWQVIGVGT